MRRRFQTILTTTAIFFFASAFFLDISQFGHRWKNMWNNVDAGSFFLILLTDLAVGLFLALFFFRKRTYKQRLSMTVPIAFILFAIADFGNIFIHEYGLFDEYNYFIAKRDIGNGKIQLLSAGLRLPSGNEEEQRAEEAIRHDFGFTSVWIGCIWTPGVEKYNAVMEDYLKERNGDGWQERMRQRLDSLRNSKKHH